MENIWEEAEDDEEYAGVEVQIVWRRENGDDGEEIDEDDGGVEGEDDGGSGRDVIF